VWHAPKSYRIRKGFDPPLQGKAHSGCKKLLQTQSGQQISFEKPESGTKVFDFRKHVGPYGRVQPADRFSFPSIFNAFSLSVLLTRRKAYSHVVAIFMGSKKERDRRLIASGQFQSNPKPSLEARGCF
jgi:hypothetical protein